MCTNGMQLIIKLIKKATLLLENHNMHVANSEGEGMGGGCVFTLASSPGSNAGTGGKRELGIHCLRMRQKFNVIDVTSPYVTRL